MHFRTLQVDFSLKSNTRSTGNCNIVKYYYNSLIKITGSSRLTKVEVKYLKPQSSLKGLWTVVREAIYWYKFLLPLKQSVI